MAIVLATVARSAGDRDDVASLGFLDRYALQATKRHDLGARPVSTTAPRIERMDRHVDLERAEAIRR